MHKELLEYLGIDPTKVVTIDDFKPLFDTNFVRLSAITEDSEYIKPIIGKIYGTQESEVKKIAKVYEIDIDTDDYKSLKKVAEKFDYVMKRKDELSKFKIAELETKVGAGNDDKLKDALEKYTKLESKQKDTQSLLDKTISDYEKSKGDWTNQIKGVKMDTLKAKELEQIKFKATISPIEKKGFLAEIHDKYSFDLDEKDNIFITDKEGKRINSTKVTGAFKTIQEVLTEEAMTAKVYQENQQGGAPAKGKTLIEHKQTTTDNVVPERVVAPRMG